jgi:hypothetical protein
MMVTNRGTLPAHGVLFTNELPAGVSVLWVSFGRGTCTIEDRLIWWRIGDLAANGAVQLAVTMVSPTEDFYAGQVLVGDSEGKTSASTLPVWRVGNPPLLLEVTLVNGQVELSWPLTPERYVLESSAATGAEASWMAVPDAPAVVTYRNMVVVPPSAESQFYRLRQE